MAKGTTFSGAIALLVLLNLSPGLAGAQEEATVMLTSSEDWRLAAAASGLASYADYPLYTTPRDELKIGVKNELEFYDKLYILGSEGMISSGVEEEIVTYKDKGYPGFFYMDITRVAGGDLYETAALMADLWEDPNGTILVRSDLFPDPLVASQLSSAMGAPILYTEPSELPEPTLSKIEELKLDVTIVGGPEAVSPQVESAVRAAGVDVERIGGVDRYETSALVAERYMEVMKEKGKNISNVIFVSGEKGWATTAGIRSYQLDSIVLLVRDSTEQARVSPYASDFIASHPELTTGGVIVEEGASLESYRQVVDTLEGFKISKDERFGEFHMQTLPEDEWYKVYLWTTDTTKLSMAVSNKIKTRLQNEGILYKPERGEGEGGEDGGGGGGGS